MPLIESIPVGAAKVPLDQVASFSSRALHGSPDDVDSPARLARPTLIAVATIDISYGRCTKVRS